MSRRSSLQAKPVPVETGPPATEVAYLIPWLLLFAGSGCAALIYEIVWFQLLQLVIGSSAISLALLLAAYMGGLCLGSAALPRLVSARHHPMRVYALLELGICAFGIVALFGVPLIGRLYLASATSGLLGVILRGVVASACLLPPTLLMGGSLPAMARWVETTPKGVSWLGLCTARISPERSLAVWRRASICFASTTWGSRPTRRGGDQRGSGSARVGACGTRQKLVACPAGRREFQTAKPDGSFQCLCSHRALGTECAGSRSGVDAAVVPDAGRDGLHVLDRSGGVSVWTVGRHQRRFVFGPPAASRTALGTRGLPGTCSPLPLPGRLSRWLILCPTGPSIRGFRPAPGSLSTWTSPGACGRFSPATLLWGASFPLALAGAAVEGEDPARLVGRDVRGQYRRSHCGRAGVQPGADSRHRNTAAPNSFLIAGSRPRAPW